MADNTQAQDNTPEQFTGEKVDAFDNTPEGKKPIILFKTSKGRYVRSEHVAPYIQSGQIQSPYKSSQVKGISQKPRNWQEQQEMNQTMQSQQGEANLTAVDKTAQTFGFQPEQYDQELQKAGVFYTPQGQQASKRYRDKVTGINAPLQDLQQRQDFLFDTETPAAFARAKEGEQQAEQSPEGQAPTSIKYREPTGLENRTMQLWQAVVRGVPMEEVNKELFDAQKQEQLFGGKKELAEMNYENKSKNSKVTSNPYDPEAEKSDYAMAQYIADDNVPVSQWTKLSSMRSTNAGERKRMLSTILSIDPDYKWDESEFDFTEGKSQASSLGRTTPKAVAGQATLTHAKALAGLEPDVQAGKVEQAARSNTAKTLNNQLAAAQRATSTFDDALNKANGKYENIPQFMYRDLASDYAKMLVSSGNIAEGSVDKVMQASLAGNIVGMWNAATGDTKTTAPQKVLKLMHDRIVALKTDISKQLANQVSGSEIPVNSNPSTAPKNPLSRKPQGIAKPKMAQPKSRAEVQALKPGTHFMWNGVEHVKN